MRCTKPDVRLARAGRGLKRLWHDARGCGEDDVRLARAGRGLKLFWRGAWRRPLADVRLARAGRGLKPDFVLPAHWPRATSGSRGPDED